MTNKEAGGDAISPPFYAMADKRFITVLGLGNILLQDEGFGVHFVRRMAEKYRFPADVDIVEGGTLAYNLLDIICSCERLIVIDVLKTDDDPGAVYRFTREEMELNLPPATSAHEVQFQDVLIKAELMEETPEVIFLCIVPQAYDDFNLEMTQLMWDRFDVMEDLFLKELAAHSRSPEQVI
jgi:hydrogenase maturation protease